MPILSYEPWGQSTPNDHSTTGAQNGYVAAIIKHDNELSPAQVYSELAANRLAQFLGLPVAMGVAVQSRMESSALRFASLKASETGLNCYDFTDHDASFDEDNDVNDGIVPGMHVGSGHISALQKVCQHYPVETAQIAVFDLWIGNDDRPGNLKAELSVDGYGVIFAIDQGASLLSCTDRRSLAFERLRSPDFPRFHAFQKLVSPGFCEVMIDRISAIPDWAMLSAMTFDDNVGSVTIAEQHEVCEILKGRRDFLWKLVERVLL